MVNEWVASGLDALPMPLQGMLIEDLEEGVKEASLDNLSSSSGGQVAGLIKNRRPAAEIVENLVEQAITTLAKISQQTMDN